MPLSVYCRIFHFDRVPSENVWGQDGVVLLQVDGAVQSTNQRLSRTLDDEGIEEIKMQVGVKSGLKAENICTGQVFDLAGHGSRVGKGVGSIQPVGFF